MINSQPSFNQDSCSFCTMKYQLYFNYFSKKHKRDFDRQGFIFLDLGTSSNSILKKVVTEQKLDLGC